MARSITTRSTNPKIMDDNIKILDDALASASTPEASDVSYDNTDSGLTATDVQAAIDELNNTVYKKSNKVRSQLLASTSFTYDSSAKYWYSNETYTALYGTRDLISMHVIPSYAAASVTAYINSSGRICVAGVVTSTMAVFDDQFTFDVYITQIKLDTDN